MYFYRRSEPAIPSEPTGWVRNRVSYVLTGQRKTSSFTMNHPRIKIPWSMLTFLLYVAVHIPAQEVSPNPRILSPTNENTDVSIAQEVVQVLHGILQDSYLREPIGIVVDNAQPFLQRTQAIWDVTLHNFSAIKPMFILSYNDTGVEHLLEAKTPEEVHRNLRQAHSPRQRSIKDGGAAFYALLKAAEKISYDSALLLFTGREAMDEDLAQLASQSLLVKRARLYVVWCGSVEQSTKGPRPFYAELAERTGGGLYISGGAYWDADKESIPSFEDNLILRMTKRGKSEVQFPVDSSIISVTVTIKGFINNAIVHTAAGHAIDLAQEGVGENVEVLARRYNLVSARFDTTDVATQGMWKLDVVGARSDVPYNISVRAASTLSLSAAIVSNETTAIRREDNVEEDPEERLQLRIVANVSSIESVVLVNEHGEELRKLDYMKDGDEDPVFTLSTQDLPKEPYYLQLTGEDLKGSKFSRVTSVKRQVIPANEANSVFSVDLDAQSYINPQPGEVAQIIFNVTNLNINPEWPYVTCQVEQGSEAVLQLNVQPPTGYIAGGASIPVRVIVQTKPNTALGTVITISLTVRPRWMSFPVATRATYIYIGVPKVTDTERPTVTHHFKENCKNVPQESCSSSVWKVEVSVKDKHSGLLSVTSNPRGVQFVTPFIAGTKEEVRLYYTATCCAPIVDIIAKDMQKNDIVHHLDVNEDGQLSESEIGLIILGIALFIILLVAIVLGIYIARRKRSHNLPRDNS